MKINRRHFVMGGASTLATLAVGCRPSRPVEYIVTLMESQTKIGGAAAAANPRLGATIAEGQVSREITEGLALRAFLRMIYWAEGTYPNAANMEPYKIIFSYQLAPNYNDHPRICIPIPHHPLGYCSDAAGIGQFISEPTWDGIWAQNPGARISGLPKFHPRHQDRAMAILLGNSGAYWTLSEGSEWKGLEEGVTTNRQAFDRAVNQAAVEWASLPLPSGVGIGWEHGGQHAKSLDSLWKVYQENLNSWKAAINV